MHQYVTNTEYCNKTKAQKEAGEDGIWRYYYWMLPYVDKNASNLQVLAFH